MHIQVQGQRNISALQLASLAPCKQQLVQARFDPSIVQLQELLARERAERTTSIGAAMEALERHEAICASQRSEQASVLELHQAAFEGHCAVGESRSLRAQLQSDQNLHEEVRIWQDEQREEIKAALAEMGCRAEESQGSKLEAAQALLASNVEWEIAALRASLEEHQSTTQAALQRLKCQFVDDVQGALPEPGALGHMPVRVVEEIVAIRLALGNHESSVQEQLCGFEDRLRREINDVAENGPGLSCASDCDGVASRKAPRRLCAEVGAHDIQSLSFPVRSNLSESDIMKIVSQQEATLCSELQRSTEEALARQVAMLHGSLQEMQQEVRGQCAASRHNFQSHSGGETEQTTEQSTEELHKEWPRSALPCEQGVIEGEASMREVAECLGSMQSQLGLLRAELADCERNTSEVVATMESSLGAVKCSQLDYKRDVHDMIAGVTVSLDDLSRIIQAEQKEREDDRQRLSELSASIEMTMGQSGPGGFLQQQITAFEERLSTEIGAVWTAVSKFDAHQGADDGFTDLLQGSLEALQAEQANLESRLETRIMQMGERSCGIRGSVDACLDASRSDSAELGTEAPSGLRAFQEVFEERLAEMHVRVEQQASTLGELEQRFLKEIRSASSTETCQATDNSLSDDVVMKQLIDDLAPRVESCDARLHSLCELEQDLRQHVSNSQVVIEADQNCEQGVADGAFTCNAPQTQIESSSKFADVASCEGTRIGMEAAPEFRQTHEQLPFDITGMGAHIGAFSDGVDVCDDHSGVLVGFEVGCRRQLRHVEPAEKEQQDLHRECSEQSLRPANVNSGQVDVGPTADMAYASSPSAAYAQAVPDVCHRTEVSNADEIRQFDLSLRSLEERMQSEHAELVQRSEGVEEEQAATQAVLLEREALLQRSLALCQTDQMELRNTARLQNDLVSGELEAVSAELVAVRSLLDAVLGEGRADSADCSDLAEESAARGCDLAEGSVACSDSSGPPQAQPAMREAEEQARASTEVSGARLAARQRSMQQRAAEMNAARRKARREAPAALTKSSSRRSVAAPDAPRPAVPATRRTVSPSVRMWPFAPRR